MGGGTTAESPASQLTLGDSERDLASKPGPRPARSDAVGPQPPSHASDGRELGERQLLSVAEVARATCLSVNAIIWSGELRASKLRGRIRVPAEALTTRVDQARVLTNPPSASARRPWPLEPPSRRRGGGLRELLQAAGSPPSQGTHEEAPACVPGATRQQGVSQTANKNLAERGF
jgi:hypothetical protein